MILQAKNQTAAVVLNPTVTMKRFSIMKAAPILKTIDFRGAVSAQALNPIGDISLLKVQVRLYIHL